MWIKVAVAGCLLLAGQVYAQPQPQWEQYFTEFNATGTMVLLDERKQPQQVQVYNEQRARQLFSPASTFKIPHTLFALDAGVVTDEFQVLRWDGKQHSFDGHNQDQTLHSAMRYSAVWVYEQFAAELGEEKARQYLKKLNYGNADPRTAEGVEEPYWIDGKLAVSAYQQLDFLRSLYRNTLPFQVEHQRLVKDIIITEAGRSWILRAKTGWTGRLGWWVGWVEQPEGAVFFALNIGTPQGAADLYKREAIGRAVLRSVDALPAE